MTFKTSIVPLILIFTLIVGKKIALGCDVEDDSDDMPGFMSWVNRLRDEEFHSCKFNLKARCMSIVTEITMDISDLGYVWTPSDRTDCFIMAKTQYPEMSNDSDTVEAKCMGIGNGLLNITLGDSTELQCTATNENECFWTRGDKILTKNDNYETDNCEKDHCENDNYSDSYFQDNGCSIQINPILPFDLTLWRCFDTTPRMRLSGIYNLVIQDPSDSLP